MITYLTGDATEPQGEGVKIIAHICNSIGAWGSGFVMALSKKWITPEAEYRHWAKEGNNLTKFELGNVQFVWVEKEIFVANMIAQEGVGFKNGIPPIRYEALRECLRTLNIECTDDNKHTITVHMPRIGSGLAGGDWAVIEAIINDTITVDVFVYDLPK